MLPRRSVTLIHVSFGQLRPRLAKLTRPSLPDLYPENILLQIPIFDALSVEEVYEYHGEPDKVPVFSYDKKPLGKDVSRYTVLFS